jgi:PAT family beta-lactamase induction signal transducer AmpG
VPLLLAEAYGWNFSYAVMAALMTVGVLAVLAAPREERHVHPPDTDRGHRTRSRS